MPNHPFAVIVDRAGLRSGERFPVQATLIIITTITILLSVRVAVGIPT